jgi:shikimate dehydrogenase
MSPPITGATLVAGVVGRPVRHSLSPLIHNAWLAAAGIDGVYVALSPAEAGFASLIDGLRGGAMRGVNVTLPFKAQALALADRASPRARAAGAANVLVFEADGAVTADNTDGVGLLTSLTAGPRPFDPARAPVVVLGAGGAAQGALAALLEAGAPEIRLINRTRAKAEALAAFFGPRVTIHAWSHTAEALAGAGALINATSLGLAGGAPLEIDLAPLPREAVVMDMVYTPLETPLLAAARAVGHHVDDGLSMLIGQAVPSFEAFFGAPPPASVDVRGLCLRALGEAG